jgi:hypothetical protein
MVFKYVSVETGNRTTPVIMIFDHKTKPETKDEELKNEQIKQCIIGG